eukprot:gene4807-21118_t
MCGVTRREKIRNEMIRKTVKVAEISSKMQESRLNWYGHVMRREEEYVGRRVMLKIPGYRRRGRPKFRWKDRLKEDMREKNLNVHQVGDREKWKRLSRNSDPIKRWVKLQEKKTIKVVDIYPAREALSFDKI